MQSVRWLLIGTILLMSVPGEPARSQDVARTSGELVWAIRYDPKTFDPAKVDEQASEMVRFLTAGVLLRFNPVSQQPEPELAESWNISSDGRTVSFRLRPGLHFSDG